MHGAQAGLQVEHEGVALLLHQGADGGGDVLDQRLDLNVFRVGGHAVGLDLREVEHVVDEAEQVAGVGLYLPDIGEHGGVAGVLHLLLQHLAVADDGGQRRAKLVAHVGEELALRAVGGLGGVLGGVQLGLGELALGDVGVSAGPLAHRAVLQQGDAAHGHGAPLAVGAAQAVLDGVQGVVPDGVGPGQHGRVPVFGVDGLQPAGAGVLGLGLAGEGGPAGLRRRQLATGAGDPDDAGAGFDQGAVALLAVLQPALGPLAVGDVGHDHAGPGRLRAAVRGGQGEEAELEAAGLRRVDEALGFHLDLGDGPASVQDFLQARLQRGAGVGDDLPQAAADIGLQGALAHFGEGPVHVLHPQAGVQQAQPDRGVVHDAGQQGGAGALAPAAEDQQGEQRREGGQGGDRCDRLAQDAPSALLPLVRGDAGAGGVLQAGDGIAHAVHGRLVRSGQEHLHGRVQPGRPPRRDHRAREVALRLHQPHQAGTAAGAHHGLHLPIQVGQGGVIGFEVGFHAGQGVAALPGFQVLEGGQQPLRRNQRTVLHGDVGAGGLRGGEGPDGGDDADGEQHAGQRAEAAPAGDAGGEAARAGVLVWHVHQSWPFSGLVRSTRR